MDFSIIFMKIWIDIGLIADLITSFDIHGKCMKKENETEIIILWTV